MLGDGGGEVLAATSMGYSVLGGQFTRDTCKRYIFRGPEINIAATSTSVASGWPDPSFPVAVRYRYRMGDVCFLACTNRAKLPQSRDRETELC